MNLNIHSYKKRFFDHNRDCFLNEPDTNHLCNIMRHDITKFYNTLSGTGKRIIATIIQSAFSLDEPLIIVSSALRHTAKCSKISVIRTLPKAKKAGLFDHQIHKEGRRNGTIIYFYKERCDFFISLFEQEYPLISDIKCRDYQKPSDTKKDQYQKNIHNKQKIQTNVVNQTSELDSFFGRLSNQGKRVLSVLFTLANNTQEKEIPFIIQSIAKEAECSEITARRVIKQGQKYELYDKKTHPRGPRFGSLLQLNENSIEHFERLFENYPVYNDTKNDWYHDRSDTKHDWYLDRNDTNHVTNHDQYPVTKSDHYKKTHVNHSITEPFSTNKQYIDTNHDRYQTLPLLDRQIRNLSSSKESTDEKQWATRLLSISHDDFQILWPKLNGNKFGTDQIRQIVEHRLSFGETILDIENSLHAAEWELTHETFPETRKGICNYLFATLKNKGTWRRPAGFLTPNEQALANAKKEKSVIRELQELDKINSKKADQAARDERFEAWLATQTHEELQVIDTLCPMPPSTEKSKRTWRKSYWMKKNNRNAA